ncbi:hypothetical protein BABINDRAFT_12593 [Babjeviella inositovora NRRL Y-12698]|uniref:Carboxylic ester hydrolase n=1 Tax=Babjeviella inositovora NRRL Y-12698 TaxID=984486 RepID=A0A1E3QUM8_9ASCO|nr:uncharacterized protein BABINDRAFT_12593 [Babjeviella inositovora NRRL Y-12698]ODQ81368.1 hypothetical protein BABINDRAFT_12593 [Babjeviella inositovora NRRL Y-12698]
MKSAFANLGLALQFLTLASSINGLLLGPQIQLPDGDTITGNYETLNNLESYLGIPFAAPPVGDLRFRPPQAYNGSLNGFQALTYGPSCPQMDPTAGGAAVVGALPNDVVSLVMQTPLFGAILPLAEDCLTLNVYRKRGLSSTAKLPVMFWIFGGGFEIGGSSTYTPEQLMAQGALQGQDFIYVSINYRLAAFGFLGGKEVKAEGSGNVGLLDQRLALQWVADNIAAFGGDPSKVTIFGESAGAISVGHQIIGNSGDNTYKGKPLFRAAIMQSGSVLPTQDIDAPFPQLIFDTVANAAGCGTASDKMACLRGVPYSVMLAACNSVPAMFSYESLQLSYMPRPDGGFIPYQQMQMVADGKYARVPYIIGDQDDEGSLFALTNLNVTTNAEVAAYIGNVFPGMSSSQMTELLTVYPQDVTQGSPFNTGLLNALTPENKRIAAFLGDVVFQAPRRFFLNNMPDVTRYTFDSQQLEGTPIAGTFHANDIIWQYYVTGSGSLVYRNAFIAFANTLNPNSGGIYTLTNWPQYQNTNALANNMLYINAVGLTTGKDNYRQAAISFLNENYLDILA